MKNIRIVHLDLTAFFVSVERLLDPSLVGKPVIVAGRAESRGVVACASYEARHYGVRAGIPTGAAERKCPSVIRVDAHYDAYEKYSTKVQQFLKTYSPIFEAASVDEFYMDWTGCEKLFGGDLFNFALRIQKTISTKFGLPCALGIASNKMAAKIACGQAKPEGVIEIAGGHEATFLKPLSVGAISGVGEITLEKFHLRGIRTCGQLAKTDSEMIGQSFGKVGLAVQQYARGGGDRFLTVEREQKKISRETTFATDTRDIKFLSETLHEMILEITEELRCLDLKAQCLHVKIRYSDWVDHTRQVKISPSNDPGILYQNILRLLKKADTRRVTMRLIGVGLSKLTHDVFTMDMLKQDEEKREHLLKAVDKINYKYGESVVKVGCVGTRHGAFPQNTP